MTGGPTPEACMRPVAKAPFYAIELINGTIGTNGGARIDAGGRVLGAQRRRDPRPVRRGQRVGVRLRPGVSGRRRHHRAGADVRLPRRAGSGSGDAAGGLARLLS